VVGGGAAVAACYGCTLAGLPGIGSASCISFMIFLHWSTLCTVLHHKPELQTQLMSAAGVKVWLRLLWLHTCRNMWCGQLLSILHLSRLCTVQY
jgi:hypothetical protein